MTDNDSNGEACLVIGRPDLGFVLHDGRSVVTRSRTSETGEPLTNSSGEPLTNSSGEALLTNREQDLNTDAA